MTVYCINGWHQVSNFVHDELTNAEKGFFLTSVYQNNDFISLICQIVVYMSYL